MNIEDLELDSLENQTIDYILSSLDHITTYIPPEQGCYGGRMERVFFLGIGVEFELKMIPSFYKYYKIRACYAYDSGVQSTLFCY